MPVNPWLDHDLSGIGYRIEKKNVVLAGVKCLLELRLKYVQGKFSRKFDGLNGVLGMWFTNVRSVRSEVYSRSSIYIWEIRAPLR